jgi:hypothetical protein
MEDEHEEDGEAAEAVECGVAASLGGNIRWGIDGVRRRFGRPLGG